MQPDIGFLLKVIQEHLDRHANQLFKPVDLTSSQFRVLKFIRGRGQEPTTQKEIEEHLQVTHPTVTGIVKRLEQKGFVRCEFGGRDRRMKYVYLTEKEAQLFEEMERSRIQMERFIAGGMEEEEIAQLRTLLIKVLENVRV